MLEPTARLVPVCACDLPRFRMPRKQRPCPQCATSEPPPRYCSPVAAVALALTAPLDEYQAAELLFELRFGGDWGCDGCGHTRCVHRRTRPRVFACCRCGQEISVTAGTPLHRSRVSLRTIVAAVRLLTRAGSITARALAAELQVGLETAWTLGHRIRAGFLDVPPIPLRRPTRHCVSGFARRPERGAPRAPGGVRYHLLRGGRHLAVVAGDADPHAARRFADRHRAGEPTTVAGDPDDPRSVGDGTHGGVSDRWLASYLHALVGWHNARVDEQDPVAVTLRATLSSRRHPFARLRPGPPPPAGRWR